MTKKEVIKLLDKEVGLFNENEDENSLGELYLTEVQFKDVGLILTELKRKRKEANEWVDSLRKIVQGNKRFIVKRSY